MKLLVCALATVAITACGGPSSQLQPDPVAGPGDGAQPDPNLAASPELAVGDEAPDFTLPGSDGQTYSLRELRGQRAVVIAWFPKAFTGG